MIAILLLLFVRPQSRVENGKSGRKKSFFSYFSAFFLDFMYIFKKHVIMYGNLISRISLIRCFWLKTLKIVIILAHRNKGGEELRTGAQALAGSGPSSLKC